ncbi:hypothetical protein BBD42_06775 [Paenibacillus sp. BIHB 4019]|uniref:HTH araC/xylS-type domain-containing protein n=1 Tax=Paenibacillus sp. BIHB 4019 TaxID=1870819 RepID=A0A1B2DEU0_9BACL|nr:AraC family transcriptional regulator [Paenibacillus sp. BIHB 4019]ANY66199.1 hypothetical protein BBD42_06775 [Paenibacillus sp. BIHB 4019]
MGNEIENLYSSVNRFAITDGINRTIVPYLEIHSYREQDIIIPDTPNPFIYLVVNGTMRLHFATGVSDYAPGQYLISAIDSPKSGMALSASQSSPFLALYIEFSVDDIVSVMLDMEADFMGKIFEKEMASKIQPHDDYKLLDVIMRLLNINEKPDEMAFMTKHLKREIILNLITGPYGKTFAQSIVKIQQAGDIYYTNSWIKQHYKDTFTVEDLAEQSNMSVSSFHQKFKSAVGMGPLQCQKKLRLMEARQLMLDKTLNVTDAAMEVGYESLSHFNRDYRRLFGLSPQKDIQEIRNCLYTKAQFD